MAPDREPVDALAEARRYVEHGEYEHAIGLALIAIAERMPLQQWAQVKETLFYKDLGYMYKWNPDENRWEKQHFGDGEA